MMELHPSVRSCARCRRLLSWTPLLLLAPLLGCAGATAEPQSAQRAGGPAVVQADDKKTALADKAEPIGSVTDKDLLSAASNNANWLMYGRTYDAQRFSPLAVLLCHLCVAQRWGWGLVSSRRHRRRFLSPR